MGSYSIRVSKEDFPRKYLTVLNGEAQLSKNELDVLEQFIKKYMELKEEGLSGEYLNRILFDSKTRKEIYTNLGITASNLNNYFKKLVDKELIEATGDIYMLDPQLIPQEIVTFKFEVI